MKPKKGVLKKKTKSDEPTNEESPEKTNRNVKINGHSMEKNGQLPNGVNDTTEENGNPWGDSLGGLVGF